jgi:hypothetical protein
MLLRQARCWTRLDPLYRAHSRTIVCRAYITAQTLSFHASTRPVAKPRAQQTAESTPCHQITQRRGPKSKAAVSLDDLPQGVIESTALPPQDDAEPEYPPLLQQVRNNMLKFSHCVLVTRVGGFYEVCVRPLFKAKTDHFSCTSNMPTNLLRF